MRKLLLICGICLVTVGVTFAQTNDRERDGLKGPVKTVRVRQATIASEDAKETEGPLLVTHEVSYDQTGNRTELVLFDRTGNVSRRIKYQYGPDGKTKLGLTTHDSQNVLVRQVSYRYGSNGLRAHTTIQDLNDDGTLYKRTEITLGELGEMIEVAEYGGDGSLIKKFKPSDVPPSPSEPVSTNVRAPKDPDPTVGFGWSPGEYFDPDTHGNWTRGTTGSTSRTHASGKKVSSTEWTYREISYY